jgi:hypothetical protein
MLESHPTIETAEEQKVFVVRFKPLGMKMQSFEAVRAVINDEHLVLLNAPCSSSTLLKVGARSKWNREIVGISVYSLLDLAQLSLTVNSTVSWSRCLTLLWRSHGHDSLKLAEHPGRKPGQATSRGDSRFHYLLTL